MFDAPIDTWYLWLGVVAASTLGFGVALSLPSTPPPDAERVAGTIDAVAASEHEAVASRPLDVSAVRLGPHRVGVRRASGAAHATLAYGPVTPTVDGTALSRVRRGTPPDRVFENASEFSRAANRARNRSIEWRPVDEPLVVRRINWEGVNVTLVGT